jgi:PKD repeat protein
MKLKIFNAILITLMTFSMIGNAQNDTLPNDSTCVAYFNYQTDGLQVNFFDQSNGNYETVTWNFGDSDLTSNETNPVHTYTDAGEYDITLTIEGTDCSNTITMPVWVGTNDTIIDDSTCMAYFDYQTDGLQVSFYDQSYGNYESVTWNFGDSDLTSNETNPVHTYTDAGEYDVTLTIEGTDCSNTITMPVWVGTNDTIIDDSTCMAYFDYQTDGLQVSFFDQSYGNYESVTWNFGDSDLTSNETNPVHTYTDAGEYDVILTIEGTDCSNTITMPVWVGTNDTIIDDSTCMAYFDYLTDGLQVSFYDQSWGNYETVTWNFGDSDLTSNEINPVHTYTDAGEYDVTLTIEGTDCTNTITMPVWVGTNDTIIDDSTCMAYFDYQTDGLQVSFFDQSWGNYENVTWYFGDSTTSNEINPVHTYANTGEYDVTLSIDGAQCSNNITMPVWVGGNDTIIDDSICMVYFNYQTDQLTVDFYSYYFGGNSFEWYFGDGTTSSELNPSHTYNNPGVYTVSLYMTGENCSASYSIDIFVDDYTWGDSTNTGSCFADFSYFINDLNVDFTNSSSDVLNNYNWNFGDGNTSIEENPSHTFAYPGIFVVSLNASNDSCSSTTSSVIYLDSTIYDSINFAFVPLVEPNNTFVQFHNMTNDAKSTYTWDFGDGHTSNELSTDHSYDEIGVYSVSLTHENGTSFIMEIDLENGTYWTSSGMIGIDNPEKIDLNVYPNPANNQITISSNQSLDNAQGKIIDLNGKIIETFRVTETSTTIDVIHLTKGYYILQIINSKSTTQIPFIKN